MKELHTDNVASVINQVRSWDKAGRKRLMRSLRPAWKGMSVKLLDNKKENHLIDLRALNHILKLDINNMTVTCEPGVNFGMLSTYLTPKGLGLEVQVEMESITVGGACMGFGIETNSHITGYLHETAVDYEIVTSNGKV